MNCFRVLLVCVLFLVGNGPALAQTVDELKQQLEAQNQINELLKQRIRKLEAQLAGENGEPKVAKTQRTPTPAKEVGDPEEERALERALVRRGLAVLPPRSWEVTPGLRWAHTGSDAIRTRADDYIATLDARAGLPGGTMIGVGLPYFIEADRETGDNSGFGDLSLRIWKQFRSQSDAGPAIVGSLGYITPTGEDAGGAIPLGSEFHRLSVNVNASKSFDPMVVSGNVFYAYAVSEDVDGIETQPGDAFGVSAITSLAISPEITGNLGLSVSFVDELQRDGIKVEGTEQTVGFLDVGLGFLLSRSVFLTLFANIGITDDAPDLILGASLPTRF